jgi:hypothetical protein
MGIVCPTVPEAGAVSVTAVTDEENIRLNSISMRN